MVVSCRRTTFLVIFMNAALVPASTVSAGLGADASTDEVCHDGTCVLTQKEPKLKAVYAGIDDISFDNGLALVQKNLKLMSGASRDAEMARPGDEAPTSEKGTDGNTIPEPAGLGYDTTTVDHPFDDPLGLMQVEHDIDTNHNITQTDESFPSNPTGIRYGTSEAAILRAGFVKFFDKYYAYHSKQSDFNPCPSGRTLLVGAKTSSGSSTLQMVAGGPSERITAKTNSAWTAYMTSGVYWYNRHGQSFGFASSSSVSLTSADTKGHPGSSSRLSWHIDQPHGGYRAGTRSGLNDDVTWRKVMYCSKPVDCMWSNWNAWSQCSRTCGGGAQQRSRSIARAAKHGGHACVGNAKESRSCNPTSCPVNCVMGSWSRWTACDEKCGPGVSTRTRNVSVPAKHGGKACSDNLLENKNCTIKPCPVDCKMSNWTDHGPCSASCGEGMQQQERTIVVKHQHGGAACPQDLTRNVTCMIKHCPVDCVLGPWVDDGGCSRDCGGGKLKQLRQVEVKASYGGKGCDPVRQQVVDCKTQACPHTEVAGGEEEEEEAGGPPSGAENSASSSNSPIQVTVNVTLGG